MKGRYGEALRKHQEAAETLQALLNDVVRLEAARSERVKAELTRREEALLGGRHRGRIEAIGGELRRMRDGGRARSASQPPHGHGSSSMGSPSSPEEYGFSQLRSRAAKSTGILKKETSGSKGKKASSGKKFRFGSASVERGDGPKENRYALFSLS